MRPTVHSTACSTIATVCEQNCACERFLFAASAVHLLQRSVMESLVRTNVTRAACLVYHPVPLQLSLHSFKRHSQPPSCLQTHPIRCNILVQDQYQKVFWPNLNRTQQTHKSLACTNSCFFFLRPFDVFVLPFYLLPFDAAYFV
jgi:hypothetical protein